MPSNQPPLEKARPIEDDLAKRGVEALRSAKSGWQNIRSGTKETRKQRILRESQERSAAIREGRNPDENNWKPGDDDTYAEPPSMRKLMESHNKLQQKNLNKRSFEGTPELVILKMVSLFENAKSQRPEIVSVEESGFNTYKVIFIVD